MTCHIMIVGAPGAGKTTLAGQLAARLGIPCYSLDPIAYLDERWTPRPADERQRLVDEILIQPAWIVEGGQLGWTAPLLDAASQIIWLDPPWWALMWHVTRRRLRRGWDLRGLVIENWFWSARYQWQPYRPNMDLSDERNHSRAATAAALASYGAKVWLCRARRVPQAELARLVMEMKS